MGCRWVGQIKNVSRGTKARGVTPRAAGYSLGEQLPGYTLPGGSFFPASDMPPEIWSGGDCGVSSDVVTFEAGGVEWFCCLSLWPYLDAYPLEVKGDLWDVQGDTLTKLDGYKTETPGGALAVMVAVREKGSRDTRTITDEQLSAAIDVVARNVNSWFPLPVDLLISNTTAEIETGGGGGGGIGAGQIRRPQWLTMQGGAGGGGGGGKVEFAVPNESARAAAYNRVRGLDEYRLINGTTWRNDVIYSDITAYNTEDLVLYQYWPGSGTTDNLPVAGIINGNMGKSSYSYIFRYGYIYTLRVYYGPFMASTGRRAYLLSSAAIPNKDKIPYSVQPWKPWYTPEMALQKSPNVRSLKRFNATCQLNFDDFKACWDAGLFHAAAVYKGGTGPAGIVYLRGDLPEFDPGFTYKDITWGRIL